MVSVALIDDHPAVRAGVEAMLAPLPDLELVGAAAGEPGIWALLSHYTPTVVVLDLHHQGRDGLALSLAIKHRPDPPAVVLAGAAAVLDPADHAILAMRLAGNRADEIADTLSAPLPVIEARIRTIVNELMAPAVTTDHTSASLTRPSPTHPYID